MQRTRERHRVGWNTQHFVKHCAICHILPPPHPRYGRQTTLWKGSRCTCSASGLSSLLTSVTRMNLQATESSDAPKSVYIRIDQNKMEETQALASCSALRISHHVYF